MMEKWIENIRSLRTKFGYTQSDVARYIGCSQTTYGKFELGTKEPSVTVLIMLADLYRMSVDDLIGHEIKRLPQADVVIDNKDKSLTESSPQIQPHLKKPFDIEYAKSLQIPILTQKVLDLSGSYNSLKVNEVYQEIDELTHCCDVLNLCRIFGVSRSGYYSWKQNGSAVRDRNKPIAEEIIHRPNTINSNKAITEYLRTKPGLENISEQRVQRIIEAFGIIIEHLD